MNYRIPAHDIATQSNVEVENVNVTANEADVDNEMDMVVGEDVHDDPL